MTTSLLLGASLDGAVAAALVWLICRLLPSIPAGARAMLWWCAAAKFIVALIWTTPVALQVLPARAATIAPRFAVGALAPSTAGPVDQFSAAASLSSPPEPISWPDTLVAIWAAGVAASLVVGVAQWRRARAILRDAAEAPADVCAVVAELASEAGLPAPPTRVSAQVTTPLVVGLRRSTIVLPAATTTPLTAAEQRMALSHEIAHIRRGDLRWGCVPALAEALFFFHPLAHVCAREYALWREAACDAAVLDATGAAPEDYARLLLNLGVTRPRAGLAAAGASTSFFTLKRRLVMLQAPSSKSTSARVLAAAVVGLAALAIIPVRLTARPAVAVVDQRPQVASVSPGESGATRLDVVSSVPPEPSEGARLDAIAAEPQSAGQRERAPDATYDWRLRSQTGQPTFVIFRGDSTHLMDGSLTDLKHAEQFRKGKEELIWVRQDGREYVSRDATLLRQLHELWLPVSRLAEQQNRVAEEQSKVGERQSEIGGRQTELAIEQSKVGQQQSEIGVRQSQLTGWNQRPAGVDVRRYEIERANLEAQIAALNEKLVELERQLRELKPPMDELGAQMEQRGREMDRLGAQMAEWSTRAERDMRALIASAIASGVLQPVK